MTEYPEGQGNYPQQPPESWSSWQGAPASSATAPEPREPLPYPPPPEFYQQSAKRPPAPAYPPNPYPEYPQGYAPYPQSGQYGQGQPYPAYPPVYPPGQTPPQSAAPAAPAAQGRDTGVQWFWPIVSAVVSFAVYALVLGWQFGLGLMGLLLIHEMGHFVVIRSKGLPAGLPTFIPLLGAFVTMRRSPANVRDEAEIALAGPFAGTLGGIACLVAYWQTGIPVLLPLAYYSFLLNLLNLIPVGPLDGARVTGAISKWIWPIGLLGVGIGAYYTHDVLLIILGVFGAFQLIGRFSAAGSSSYYTISPAARVSITVIYFGMAAVLAYATYSLQPLMNLGGRLF